MAIVLVLWISSPDQSDLKVAGVGIGERRQPRLPSGGRAQVGCFGGDRIQGDLEQEWQA